MWRWSQVPTGRAPLAKLPLRIAMLREELRQMLNNCLNKAGGKGVGHIQAGVPCSDNAYSRVITALLATRMQDMKAGNSVNLAELTKLDRKLECNDDFMRIDRNIRLAAALQITNPEMTSKIIARYSDFCKDWVRRDATFCTMVCIKLTDLVKLAKESKQKSRAFSFPCMNTYKR